MFDTPDLMPLFVAPFVAILVGAITLAVGLTIRVAIEKTTNRKPAWLKVFVLLAPIGVVPIACIASIALEIGAIDPAPWFRPTTHDIVGKWELSSETTRLLGEWYHLTVSSDELVIESDGAFRLKNVPTFWGLLDSNLPENERYISGSGTWYLGQVEGTERPEWVIFAQFQEINGHPDSRLMRFYFEGHLPPYELNTLDSAGLVFRFQEK